MQSIYVPGLGHNIVVSDRETMMSTRPPIRARRIMSLPPVSVPFDWAGSFSFPMLGNDVYNICMYAAACHADQTFTGNVLGVEQAYIASVVEGYYLAINGGDTGLSESMIVDEWYRGLSNIPQANIIGKLDIDPTDHTLMNQMAYLFGGVFLMFNLTDSWISGFIPNIGQTWDVPTIPDSLKGHAGWINGVDGSNKRKLQTWGSYVWMTEAAVTASVPAAFAVFSLRWFNSSGIAPNAYTYDQLANFWGQAGGAALPDSPFGHVAGDVDLGVAHSIALYQSVPFSVVSLTQQGLLDFNPISDILEYKFNAGTKLNVNDSAHVGQLIKINVDHILNDSIDVYHKILIRHDPTKQIKNTITVDDQIVSWISKASDEGDYEYIDGIFKGEYNALTPPGNLTLAYTGSHGISMSIVLPTPEFGNKITYHQSRIEATTRGGDLIIFYDNNIVNPNDWLMTKHGWPTSEILEFDFSYLDSDNSVLLLNFLRLTLGYTITVTDYIGLIWKGFVLNPEDEIIQAGRSNFKFNTIKFQGVLQNANN